MKSWHVANPKFFQELKKSVENKYPTFYVTIENNTVYIRGSLILDGHDGCEVDRYLIEIELPSNYPKSIPLVREVAGRLPKTPDRHFSKTAEYRAGEHACLFLPLERHKYWPPGSTIIDFIEGPVKDFFYWQTDYDLNKGKSSFGARGHAANGITEFFEEQLGIRDRTAIETILQYLTKEKIKGHWSCYCGSGQILRKCHSNELKQLKEKITQDDAKYLLQIFKQST